MIFFPAIQAENSDTVTAVMFPQNRLWTCACLILLKQIIGLSNVMFIVCVFYLDRCANYEQVIFTYRCCERNIKLQNMLLTLKQWL